MFVHQDQVKQYLGKKNNSIEQNFLRNFNLPYCKPRRNSSKLWKFKQPTLGARKII